LGSFWKVFLGQAKGEGHSIFQKEFGFWDPSKFQTYIKQKLLTFSEKRFGDGLIRGQSFEVHVYITFLRFGL
jgi:hypothetical protein